MLSAGLIGAVLWPLAANDVRKADSYPLSTYPMFSQPRAREITLLHLVSITPDGEVAPVAPKWIGEAHVTAAARKRRRADVGIALVMWITFMYPLLGFAYLSFFDVERLDRRSG